MLAAEKDAVSSDTAIDRLNPIIEPEAVDLLNPIIEPDPVEEDDDWVIVEIRKITILIPPAPPVHPQIKSPEINCIPTKSRRAVKRSSHTLKKPAATPGIETKIDGVSSKPQESNQNHAAPVGNETPDPIHFNGKPKSQQLASGRVDGHGNGDARGKRRFGSPDTFGGAPRPPIGRLSVVNQRLRAINLERKLEGFGGLRMWLLSQGLGRFIRGFEREEVGKYQLANLTMSKLKDMGTDAVGPRRKLIHAIDRLCQPYFSQAMQ